MMSKKLVKSLGLIAITSPLLGGCFSLLPSPKPAAAIYRLNVPGGNTNAGEKTDIGKIVINIDYPQAARALAGTDIILSPDGRRLSAAARASWAEPLPAQIRQALIDELANSERLVGIIPKGGTHTPYRLNMDIRRFEAVFDNGEDAPPLAIVQIRFSLTDSKARKLTGTKTISTNMRAAERRVSAIVEAQDKAAKSAMRQAVDWLAEITK